MIISKDLFFFLYNFLQIEDISDAFDYLENIPKELNINSNDLIKQIKEIDSNDLYLEKKDKEFDISLDLIKKIFNLFLNKYKLFSMMKDNFIISQFRENDLNCIKTIELKDYFISCSGDQLRLYKKKECQEINKYFLYYEKEKYINLYDLNIKYPEEENFINDIMEISNNEIIFLFINLLFLFRIEEDNLKKKSYIKERYKLVKCHKYYGTKIMIGSEANIFIFERKNNFFQKIANYNIGNNFRKNYNFYKNLIVVKDHISIQFYSFDKKFKLTKIKKDFNIPKNSRINICYMKKLDMFVLVKNCFNKFKLILTDCDKIYNELKISESIINIQEYSENDQFLLLFTEKFSKYKIVENKFNLIFTITIKKLNPYQDNLFIKQISDEKYFINGMNGYIKYKYDKNDEKKEDDNKTNK